MHGVDVAAVLSTVTGQNAGRATTPHVSWATLAGDLLLLAAISGGVIVVCYILTVWLGVVITKGRRPRMNEFSWVVRSWSNVGSVAAAALSIGYLWWIGETTGGHLLHWVHDNPGTAGVVALLVINVGYPVAKDAWKALRTSVAHNVQFDIVPHDSGWALVIANDLGHDVHDVRVEVLTGSLSFLPPTMIDVLTVRGIPCLNVTGKTYPLGPALAHDLSSERVELRVSWYPRPHHRDDEAPPSHCRTTLDPVEAALQATPATAFPIDAPTPILLSARAVDEHDEHEETS